MNPDPELARIYLTLYKLIAGSILILCALISLMSTNLAEALILCAWATTIIFSAIFIHVLTGNLGLVIYLILSIMAWEIFMLVVKRATQKNQG